MYRQIKIDEHTSSIYDVKETMLESLLKNIGLTVGEAKVFIVPPQNPRRQPGDEVLPASSR